MTAIYEVKFKGAAFGQNVINSIWWRTKATSDAPLASGDMQLMASTLATRWMAQMAADFNAEYLLQRVEILEAVSAELVVPSDPNEPAAYKVVYSRGRLATLPANLNGAIVGEPLPLTIAAVCNLRTERYGRRRRGRIKLGPYSETYSDGNTIKATNLATIQGAAEQMFADVTIAGLSNAIESVVFSRIDLFSQASGYDPYQACTPITTVEVNPIWGIQRSRKYNTGLG